MNGKSLNIVDDKIANLKKVLPEAFSENKVDWEKLRIALGENIEINDERYNLNWAGKSEAFRTLQSTTTATLVADKSESVDFENTENVFIEGENLEVLKVLQKSYFGKIKMIYIDPPYNTGNDFIYSDKFKEDRKFYEEKAGIKNEHGFLNREGLVKNSKDRGHYHSSWLSMMYPRLFLAKNLLRDDGVIFISIDYNEEHNLKLLMNEIFGEENYKNTFYVSRVKKNIQETEFVMRTNFGINSILFYGKSQKSTIIPPKIKQKKKDRWHAFDAPGIRETMEYEIFGHKPPSGRHWMYEEMRAKEMIEKGLLKRNIKSGKPQYFIKANDYTLLDTNWTDLQESDSTWIKNGGKNVSLIKRMLEMMNKNDIILDFFAGSGTTAHAVLDLNKKDGGNRKFICVQIPEKCDEKSEAFKAGYKTIAEISKERIRRVIKKIKEIPPTPFKKGGVQSTKKVDCKQQELLIEKAEENNPLNPPLLRGNLDCGFKVFKLEPSNFKIWRADKIKDEKDLEKELELHIDPIVSGAKTEDILYELLLKSGIELTTKIEKSDGIYFVNDNEIALILEKIDEELVRKVILSKPQKFITLDKLFFGNDQLKTNTVLQMKDAEIDFRAV